MKLRQYFQNVSLLFVINFLIKPVWVFGIERKFQLVLGKETYGKYFSFLSSIYILSVVLDLGLHSYAVKLISEKKQDYKNYISELWISKWILIAIYLLSVFFYIGFQNLGWSDSLIFFLIAIEMLTFSAYQFLRCFTQGLQMLTLDSLLSSLDRILLIIFGGAILYLYMGRSNLSLEGFIAFHILAYTICFVSVLYYLRHYISFRLDSFSLDLLKEIVRSGYLLLIVYILMTIYSRIGPVMVRSILPNGEMECGILAYSHSIIDSAYNALGLLSVFLLPTVAFQYAEKNDAYVRKVVFASFLVATVISLGFIICCLLFSREIYAFLYHTEDIYIINVFRVQIWSVLGVGWMYVFGSYLTAIGRFKTLIAIVLTGVIICLSLNYFLIPTHKGLGSALTNTIVQLTMGVLHLIASLLYIFKKDRT